MSYSYEYTQPIALINHQVPPHGNRRYDDDFDEMKYVGTKSRKLQMPPTTPRLLYEPPVVQRKRFPFDSLQKSLRKDIATSQQSQTAPTAPAKGNNMPIISRTSFQSLTQWNSGPFAFDPNDLDLALDDDLWLPSEQVSEISMNVLKFGRCRSKSNHVETGMLFPWMVDAEIV